MYFVTKRMLRLESKRVSGWLINRCWEWVCESRDAQRALTGPVEPFTSVVLRLSRDQPARRSSFWFHLLLHFRLPLVHVSFRKSVQLEGEDKRDSIIRTRLRGRLGLARRKHSTRFAWKVRERLVSEVEEVSSFSRKGRGCWTLSQLCCRERLGVRDVRESDPSGPSHSLASLTLRHRSNRPPCASTDKTEVTHFGAVPLVILPMTSTNQSESVPLIYVLTESLMTQLRCRNFHSFIFTSVSRTWLTSTPPRPPSVGTVNSSTGRFPRDVNLSRGLFAQLISPIRSRIPTDKIFEKAHFYGRLIYSFIPFRRLAPSNGLKDCDFSQNQQFFQLNI